MKTKLVILVFITIQALSAQTITSGSISPVIGESFLLHSIDVSSASETFMDICYDFSSFTMDPFNITHNIVNPSSTSYGLYYPTSNYCVEVLGSDYYYYTSSGSGIVQNGYYVLGNQMIYSDTRKIIQYPLAPGASFSDAYLGYYMDASLNCYKRTGTMNVHWYNNGTLITSQGSFNNIIQVKTHEQFDDTQISCFDSTDMGFPTNTETFTYEYFELGRHYPLIRVDIVDPFGSSYAVGKQLVVNNLGEETSNESVCFIFYNDQNLFIQTTNKNHIVKGNLVDMTGKSVVELGDISTFTNVDINSLVHGVYLLQLYDENLKQHSFKIIR